MAVSRLTTRKRRTLNKRALLNTFFVEDDNLALYLRDISQFQPLSPDHEREVAMRIAEGDENAVAELVLANLRFVVSVSRNYQHQGMSLADLINEGNVGLIRAARRFDHRKNFKFISYAVWWIRQGILQALAHQSRIVRLPLNRVGSIYKIGKARSRLEQRFGRSPNTQEIADELSLGERDVKRMVAIGDKHASLDAPLSGRQRANLHDTLHGNQHEQLEDALMTVSLRREVEATLDTLPQRERDVVRLYFGIGEATAYTLDEIGHRFSLTRERVRQIKEHALQKLRLPANKRRLRTFH